jgi:hypothetical protein
MQNAPLNQSFIALSNQLLTIEGLGLLIIESLGLLIIESLGLLIIGGLNSHY